MDVSIMIEGQMGLNWPRWQAITATVEDAGFAGLFRSDHFVNPAPPAQDALEMVTSLTWLASHTSRIRFGVLVAPVSFRDPRQLARQAAAIDDLSGGRLTLGLGMGWMDHEHEMFGFWLGDVATRASRLREGVEVVSRLLRDEGPVTFEGSFFSLLDAVLLPRPARGPRLLVGGNGPNITLPLVARWADEWNAIFQPPAAFAALSSRLDDLLAESGRKPGDVRRSMMTGTYPGVEDEGLAARGAICGSPDQMRAQLAALSEAGCEEVMLQWLALDDLEGLRALARAVL